MRDEELREQLAAWARPLERITPPDLSLIRRRARRRVIRLGAAGVGAAAAVGAAATIALASLPPAATPIRPAVSPAPRHTWIRQAVGPARSTAPPYYVAISARTGDASVYRTATGTVTGPIAAPGGTSLVGVTAAGDGRNFILAAQTASAIRFYGLSLGPGGRPGPLALAPVPPLPGRAGNCLEQLDGLAVTPAGGALAVSTLANCPTGRAGPAKIEIVSLATGRVLTTYRPGSGYAESLSWTAGGALAYNWTGPHAGVWLIPSAASPSAHSAAHLLISESAAMGTFTQAQNPLLLPTGSAVIVTLGHGNAQEVAEFSVPAGQPLSVLIPPVSGPLVYCGGLWAGSSGRHLLAACGDGAEARIDNGHRTHLPPHWRLPVYPTPRGPQIAW